MEGAAGAQLDLELQEEERTTKTKLRLALLPAQHSSVFPEGKGAYRAFQDKCKETTLKRRSTKWWETDVTTAWKR